jgi:hypothetical protein
MKGRTMTGGMADTWSVGLFAGAETANRASQRPTLLVPWCARRQRTRPEAGLFSVGAP